jgi:hypothetical protein
VKKDSLTKNIPTLDSEKMIIDNLKNWLKYIFGKQNYVKYIQMVGSSYAEYDSASDIVKYVSRDGEPTFWLPILEEPDIEIGVMESLPVLNNTKPILEDVAVRIKNASRYKVITYKDELRLMQHMHPYLVSGISYAQRKFIGE